jgi:hypothetical protein
MTELRVDVIDHPDFEIFECETPMMELMPTRGAAGVGRKRA